MRDLTQHLTTRADANHAPPVTNAVAHTHLTLPTERKVELSGVPGQLPRNKGVHSTVAGQQRR
ncbi:hypothetical protein BGU59_19525, partial [Clostridioides difficile]